jgi:hypothetical protein
MAKKLHIDMDADSIINSVRPEIPPAPIPIPPTVSPAELPHEEKSVPPLSPKVKEVTRNRKNESEDEYMELFIREAEMAARSGKLVYVRKDYHDRILRIIRVIGKDRLSLFGYIDHILTLHFDEYEEVIKKLYKKHYKEVY